MSDTSDQAKNLVVLKQLFADPTFSPVIHDFLHELATPITIVSLNLEMLKKEVNSPSPDPQKIETLVKRVEEGSTRLQAFLTKMRSADQS